MIHPHWKTDGLVSALAFVLLAGWIVAWPASGEGDAVLHFINARLGLTQEPKILLTSWARPAFKSLVALPTYHSMTAGRLTVALMAAALVWQTIGLARDLNLARPVLAGLFLLGQPFAFAMATDLMTEIPAALVFLIAVRLWMKDYRVASCAVVSLTPLVRPEGFFLIIAWAALLTVELLRRQESVRRWIGLGLLLSAGMALWCLAAWVVTGNPLFVLSSWSWPAGSYAGYGSGTLWHHFQRWPWYVGSALFPVFLVGMCFSIRKGMGLPWLVWWLVIGVHSVLYWGGWFAALGLLRILVVSAPTTAVVCLIGFNTIATHATTILKPTVLRWGLGALYLLWVCWVAIDRYRHDPQHFNHVVAWKAAQFITSNNLLQPDTQFFTADQLMLVALDYPKRPFVFTDNSWKAQRELLRNLPYGSIGVWDNRQSNGWYNVAIPDLDDLGFERLATFETVAYYHSPAYMYRIDRGWPETIRFVVVRKVR